ncbi:hypothetical protein HOD61_02255 [archaeon]|jgi:hypothetical protein|nr:hypothetical protein [archaeon]
MIKNLENKLIKSSPEEGRLLYGMSHMLVGGSLACMSSYHELNYLEYFAVSEMFYGLYQMYKSNKEF